MARTASLRVVTFNVLGPANPDWDRRHALIAGVLRNLAADVVALQEVPIADGPELVEDLLGPGYSVRGFAHAADDGVGGALATRAPHSVLEELDQRRTPQDLPWCATLVVELDTPVGRTVVAHHKPSWQLGSEHEREQQAVAAARAVEHHVRSADHALVLGDVDAAPDAASSRFWRGRQALDGSSVCYQDVWEAAHAGEPGLTFDPRNPLVRAGEMPAGVGRRIDHVLVRCGDHGPTLRVVDCRRVLDLPVDGVWASDHFGVLADLALPEHAPGTWGQP